MECGLETFVGWHLSRKSRWKVIDGTLASLLNYGQVLGLGLQFSGRAFPHAWRSGFSFQHWKTTTKKDKAAKSRLLKETVLAYFNYFEVSVI